MYSDSVCWNRRAKVKEEGETRVYVHLLGGGWSPAHIQGDITPASDLVSQWIPTLRYTLTGRG